MTAKEKALFDALVALAAVCVLVEIDINDQDTGWYYQFKRKSEQARNAIEEAEA